MLKEGETMITERNAFYKALYDKHGANHYSKFDIASDRGRGALLWDADGKRYIDMLSCYSAVSQGHCNPNITRVAAAQDKKLGICSGAVYNTTVGLFLQKVCEVSGMEAALMKNGGVEGVETAIKAMRAWGYKQKGIDKYLAEIIVAENNFHGRTTTVISASSCELSKDCFGPFTPGFRLVKYNDVSELEKAVNGNTAGILLEPIQGEGGIIVPDDDYLPKVREVCTKNNVLLCLDEIQTGLGRTGKMFCFEHYQVRPDIVVMGKTLGGGVHPIAGIATSRHIMDTAFVPGNDGSTNGESAKAGAVGLAAIEELLRKRRDGMNLVERAEYMGNYFMDKLGSINHPLIKEVRGKGLLIGLEFREPIAHDFALALLDEGVFAKDTHGTTIRFAPPLMIPKYLVDEALRKIKKAVKKF